MRICSLLPSATEIVFALGAGYSLVGVTHECDYPEQASQIPKVTRTKIPPGISSDQIDSAVSSTLGATGSLYELDLPLLEELRPALILTQRLCDVCAVSFDHVQGAAEALKSRPRVLNLEPHSLGDILGNIRTVGEAIGRESAAKTLVRSLQLRINAVRSKTKSLSHKPRVFCMEWVNPPYCGGHSARPLACRCFAIMKYALFWSGGKDSLLALDHAKHAGLNICCPVNIYEGSSCHVRFHRVRRELIESQAKALGISLLRKYTVISYQGVSPVEYIGQPDLNRLFRFPGRTPHTPRPGQRRVEHPLVPS